MKLCDFRGGIKLATCGAAAICPATGLTVHVQTNNFLLRYIYLAIYGINIFYGSPQLNKLIIFVACMYLCS